MKIGIIVYAKPEVGLGHWFRSVELARKAERRGHDVWILGNKMLRGQKYFQMRLGVEEDYLHIIDQVQPDVIVIDVQDEVPDYLYDLKGKAKTLLLNGVGREREDRADIVVIQGFSSITKPNAYSGVEYIILREELFRLKNLVKLRNFDGKENPWFVFGGAKDKMSLLKAFVQAMPDDERAHLVVHDFAPKETIPTKLGINEMLYRVDGDALLMVMSGSGKACLAMGMIAWETVSLGLPSYVFSWSDAHLRFALEMEKKGLIRAFPRIGLPPPEEFKDFLNQPFEITGTPPDERGADRIIDILEKGQ